MAAESGYSNQKKKGQSQFKTIQPLGSNKFGASVASKALYDKTAQDSIVVTPILGATGQAEFLNVFFAGHNAIVDDLLRITSGTFINFETEIVSIIDVDNFYIPAILDSSDISGEDAIIMAWVTNKANSDGSQIVALAPTGIAFIQDASLTLVNEDTVTPANNVALPASNFIIQDGVSLPVFKNTTNSGLTVSMPVEDFGVNNTLTFMSDVVQEINVTPSSTMGVPALAYSPLVNKYKNLTVDVNNALEISVATLPLPTGAATSALQGTGNTSLSSIDGKLQSNGVIDAGNSSVTPLGIGGVFTGASFDVTKYASINVCLISDVPSATDGVKLEVSTDGVNWDHRHKTTYSAADGIGYIFNAEFKFARVVYINGAVAQSYFRLQTIFKSTYVAPSLFTLDQTVNGAMFAQLNKSTIIGKTTGGGGGFVDVKVTPSGSLTTESVVSGSVSITGSVAVTGPLTNTELRAVAVPISGTVSTGLTQPLTDSQLRAAAVPISAVSLPLPSGASTLAEQQTQTTAIGSITETAPTTDTASSGLNGRLQRIAQRLTSLIALFPTSLGTKTAANSLAVTLSSDQSAIPNAIIAGTITNAQVTVGLTAVRATVAGTAPNAARKRLSIKPSKNNTGAIYYGSSSVTTANGLEIIGPDRLDFTFDASDYYLRSDTAAQVVEIVEVI